MLKRRRKSGRPSRLKGTTIARLIPNMITVASTCAGLTGVRYALEARWEFAVAAILVAAILDALDGRMARLLRATSDFGAQLDSLSDFVAFGVSPALIVWLWGLSELGGPGWGIALFFAVCCGLRLARFNSRLDKLPPYAYNYFQGIPAPAGAAIGLLPLTLGFVLGDAALIPPWAAGLWMVGVALLMVSEVPTFSFKKFKLAPRWILPFMVIVGIFAAGLASAPWETLTIAGVAYLATIPVSLQSYARLRREADRLQAEVDPEKAEVRENGETDGETPTEGASLHTLRGQ
ncbi:MAG: phosphatidylcholine/phosphatidylserine synthase [Alphaproteobacteria bacterium]|jgi:CDP-diacylglycerol--serine O-phosphatidyltransferase|uniref:CDP-alcohol phosphatidyltransferase family protein n=1 Tax=Pacificispira sp. TaxID=2888761 RepID=UPI001B1724CA|nr:phosphatidylcholine/phosphatidylserine synthase [Alphaproteobacteria bacterium]MBO6864987.1 phosphatidylcholine/phosphatidylserine synthase [Alphaproteobacteria bacterium]MEC9267890.1 phosphatidylcholine/phosphatidylserine synthase [Pseudomonadota bacterium]